MWIWKKNFNNPLCNKKKIRNIFSHALTAIQKYLSFLEIFPPQANHSD